MPLTDLLYVAAEVAAAVAEGRAVVALESTVISHGMPFPQNVETALALEEMVRAAGAVPATIAVIDGQLRVGLTPTEIERLGRAGTGVTKVSRRDLPILLSRGGLGATTVAATMIAARIARIPVLATGGIGGVHRGATQTFDISADLGELARTSVAVVCAGAKSILDLGLTLELLETLGVPVLGYRTDRFPAFFTRTSPHAVDARVDTAAEAAQICARKWHLGIEGGVVVANPPPADVALPEAVASEAIAAATAEAAAAGVVGKALTPLLLARVSDLTSGRSLQANIALIRGNAALAAEIARELAALRTGPGQE
jgi:pseudouridine-5'-phosphate glycosidase